MPPSNSKQSPQPVRPKKFTPYRYEHSVEELRSKFSALLMERAKKAAAEMQEVIKRGPYKPDFDKIGKHRLPEWFKDAKFGIFYDWGIYSAAAHGAQGYHGNYYPDCYLGSMYDDPADAAYHKKFWGPDFERDDFIPLFTASRFDAQKLAAQCVQWGAKYVVPFCRHAGDGFSLWNNTFSKRTAVEMSPRRDLMKEMFDAFRARGLKCGFYTDVYEFEYPVIVDGKLMIRQANAANDPAFGASGYIPFDSKKHNRMVSGKIPVNDYIGDYFIPSMKEVIDVYDPDILWYDCEWYNTTAVNKTDFVTAYFFDKAEGRKEVAVNDRLGTDFREKHGDFYTSEYHVIIENLEHYWEENRPMGFSYGFNWEEDDASLMPPGQLIQMLVRIVARNGNLLLLINPDAEGRLTEIQTQRLDEIGQWLRVNGEAIYNTRATKNPADPSNTGDNVWFTRSKDGKFTYAIIFEWPGRGFMTLKNARPKWETKAYLLGCDQPLKWYDSSGYKGMYVEFPPEMSDPAKRPCRHAWVVKFENW